MLDPGLEHLHRHGRVWRWSNDRRDVDREVLVDALILVPIIALFLLAPGGEWGNPIVVAGLVIACALVSVIRFDIGSGSTTPLLVVEVPLWYLVPPAWIPVLVGIAFLFSRLIERHNEHEPIPLWRAFLGFADAWHAVGPAVVFAALGTPPADVDHVDIFILAFVAGALIDLAMIVSVMRFLHGIKPRVQAQLTLWIMAVDAALAPVGFLGAVVMVEEPYAFIALLPLVAVLGEFARERRNRLDQAVQLSSAYRGTAQLMGDVLEVDDAYTGGEHTRGVVETAVAVGLAMRLNPREMRDLEFGALLHDVGKLRVPNEIINKPGRLTDGEWNVVRRHPVFGQEMLDRVGGALADAGVVVRAHHERWDGNGYPDGLAGEAIPIAARIVTVCDSFSAMTTQRSYSRARSISEALEELRRCAGTQFDPAVVVALRNVVEREPDLVGADSTVPGPAELRALGVRHS